jgi:DNA repair protein RecO (recombination protein O)
VRRPTDISDALLLRGVDYGDSDRIVTLLTRSFGKISCIARGARRSKKRFAGALEPLQLLHVELVRGGGQLDTLARAEIARSYPRVLADLGRMAAGFAALELLRELVPELEVDPIAFDCALEFLGALDVEHVVPERLSLCFQVRLLSVLGFEPRLDQCGLCGKQPAPNQSASFDPQLGHLVCRRCGGASERLGAALRPALMRAVGPDWLEACDPAWPDTEQSAGRSALRAFVEHRVGRALRSSSLAAIATSKESASEQ